MTVNSLLSIHHLARDFVVIDKPAGLRSVPARGSDTDPSLADSVETRVRETFDRPNNPVTVHRLDRDTSGLMVLALTRKAHRALSRQFMHRKVGKSYAALLEGDAVGDEGKVDLPLHVDWPNRPLQCVNHQHGRPATTLWRITQRLTSPARTRVSFRPETGRTHQLRVHAATPRSLGGLGCPILGDDLYGTPGARLHLHADTLAFWEPHTGQWAKFHSPAPF
ncbi:MAG: RluA family pseudouridine synthase [Phycisphaerales bacterium]